LDDSEYRRNVLNCRIMTGRDRGAVIGHCELLRSYSSDIGLIKYGSEYRRNATDGGKPK